MVQVLKKYDFSEKALSPTCAGRYFLTLSGGLQVQNSALMRRASAADRLGFHATFGVGRRFTDFFDLKLSAAYSKNTWQVYYGGQRMPAQYYALRLEGEFDILRFAIMQLLALEGLCERRFSGRHTPHQDDLFHNRQVRVTSHTEKRSVFLK